MAVRVTTRAWLRPDLRWLGVVQGLVAVLVAACSEPPRTTCPGYENNDSSQADAASEEADATPPPSCSSDGKSLPVLGGTFYRSYSNNEGCHPQDLADQSSVSSFRLDKYAVTVGRFRQFVEAWNGGWRPDEGSGKHGYLNDGKGLRETYFDDDFEPRLGGYEPGWWSTRNDGVSLTTADLTSCTGSNLLELTEGPDHYKLVPYSCNTWTDKPGDNERLPMVCVNGSEAYAFCIWDGGFLPSDAELEYAAAGGSEQRRYPWGPAEPGEANQYAIYGCNYPTQEVCWDASKIAPVGTTSLGLGRWGHLDLAGNVWQWALDSGSSYVSQCDDCALLNTDDPTSYPSTVRGGGFHNDAGQLVPAYYWTQGADKREHDTGIRCARAP